MAGFAPAPAPTLSVYSPSAYQVFQRNTSNNATILIRGRVDNFPPPYNIEARLNFGDWQVVATSTLPQFQGWLDDVPAGQYTLEVRLAESVEASTSVQYVGVGDVYVLGGQSNAVGQGRTNQVYSHPTLKAGLFTLGGEWTELKDPVSIKRSAPTIYNVTPAGGSMWPLLATELMAARNAPVAFIPCASNGQGVIPWQPILLGGVYDPATLFGSCVNRIQWQPDGIAGVLWVGGEENVGDRMSSRVYADGMEAVADAFWNCCQSRVYLSFIQHIDHTGVTDAEIDEVNAGVQMAINENDAVLPGADFRAIETNLHFISSQQLQAAADAWALTLSN